ncbi:bacteriophage protein [Mycolicibacterium conceptionense]|uniref:Bacteriophage protein n=1 Tax=Mycolicibacterium conceptionense TaxID=451644 RepID=A0A0U1DI59_9MYCO|nr:peptidoglycan-binding protein [Mycolicibacterium conceptionense]ORV20074.1 hypothetical protein AWB98_29475 [Mycolicibacterium conceptionense]CQD15638.1 bacteriophage protein [Mycolicibacterium conceptionense]
MPIRLGDRNESVRQWRHVMNVRFGPLYTRLLGELPQDTDEFGPRAKSWQEEYERRTTQVVDGVVSDDDLRALGVPIPSVPVLPVMFTVEGHLSNMFAGPVADTATQLEAEGVCVHQPTGYNNGAIPFDNKDGVRALAENVGATVLPSGKPFPAGTPWSMGIFSQGGIIGFDFYVDYLMPGKPLNWRLNDLRAVLAYGPPCRGTDSIAPWAESWIKTKGTHGLDPYRRFGINGYPEKPDYWVDVYREGDIFAQNGDDKASKIKAAVYQAIARGDVFSNPYSLAMEIAGLFLVPVEEVIGIVLAIVSGVGFLATGNDNPHYSPYDISGGKAWMRQKLTAA